MTSTANLMHSLYSQFGELAGITIEIHKELIAIAVENQAATARVFLQGAQVCDYARKNQPPILWLSPLCEYRPGQPLRGGVPICWPWFGALDKNPQTIKQQIKDNNSPAHGLVRDRNWQLLDIQIQDARKTRLLFSLDIIGAEEALWPYSSQLQLQVDIGETLEIQLTISNLDQRAFSFSNALHTYFHVSDIDKVEVAGLENKTYIDAIDNWEQKKQQGPIRVNQEVDRIYQQLDQAISLNDEGLGRTITIKADGSHSAIIWNPWVEKSRTLSCFDELAYQQMICIETANVLDDSINLEPGQSHRLGVHISSRSQR